MQVHERLFMVVTPDDLWRLGWERGQLFPKLSHIARPALRRVLDVVDLGRRVVLEHVEQGELGLILCRLLKGLAAAAKPKPTVAYYTRYFSYLQSGFLPMELASYSDALHPLAISVYDNFPEKSASVGENRVCNTLKMCNLSVVSFPKKLLLGRVCCFSCALTAALLP